MNTLKYYLVFLLVAAGGVNQVSAQATNAVNTATRGTDEKSFRIITERNIFNQSRSSRSSRNTNNTPEGEKPRPVQVDTFSLVGTMVYDKGPVAFMVGSGSEFQKPIKPGESFAGYKVDSVAPNLVTLSRDDQKVEMRVGMQMKRQDGGEWKLSEEAPVYSSSSGSKSSGSSDNSSSGAGSSEEEEILRRLMEKRAKELDK